MNGYSVCTDAVFHGMDFEKSVELLTGEGFCNIEFWSWWDKDLDQILWTKQKYKFEVIAFCTKFISLTQPSARKVYLKGLEETIAVAEKLGCHKIITQIGDDIKEPRSRQMKSVEDGLRESLCLLKDTGIILLIEPLNAKIDHPGSFLSGSGEAFTLVDQMESQQVRVLYDIYHQQVTEGDVVRTIRENIGKIGHFHAAGNPGRNELYRGELNYRFILDEIAKSNYEGMVGFEYFPTEDPIEGLKKYRGNKVNKA